MLRRAKRGLYSPHAVRSQCIRATVSNLSNKCLKTCTILLLLVKVESVHLITTEAANIKLKVECYSIFLERPLTELIKWTRYCLVRVTEHARGIIMADLERSTLRAHSYILQITNMNVSTYWITNAPTHKHCVNVIQTSNVRTLYCWLSVDGLDVLTAATKL